MSDMPDDVMEVWLSACICCRECNQAPCGGVAQGGVCDQMPCRCEDDDYLDADDYAECTWCGGEGLEECDDPGWCAPGELVPCTACNGKGLRKHQTVF